MNKKHLITYCLAVLTLCSCGNFNVVQKSRDYEFKYEAAKQYYAEGKYSRASLILNEVILVLKGTDRGEESLFLLAMSQYKGHDYEGASKCFRKYYQTYPRGIYTELARFYCGKSLYELTPEPKLDQTDTYVALTELQNFLDIYPYTHYKEEAHKYIFALQDKLIDKEFNAAQLYYNLGSYFGNSIQGGSNFQACIITAQNAINDFPYSSRREEFALMVLRAKYELARQSVESKSQERYRNAIDEYYGFLNEYPESKFMDEAKSIFNKASKKVKDTNK